MPMDGPDGQYRLRKAKPSELLAPYFTAPALTTGPCNFDLSRMCMEWRTVPNEWLDIEQRGPFNIMQVSSIGTIKITHPNFDLMVLGQGPTISLHTQLCNSQHYEILDTSCSLSRRDY